MPNRWPVIVLMATGFSLAQADMPFKGPDVSASEISQLKIKRQMEKSKVLTNQEAWTVYERYISGWKAIADDHRSRITAEVTAENVLYSTPQHQSGGRETMIEDMAAFQKRFPGGHFDVGEVSVHHDLALLTWVLVQADGSIVAKGHDQIRVSPDGKIVSLITFAPSVTHP